MDNNFKDGKFYEFYRSLWGSIGSVGTLRKVKDSYDIIIDLCKGYYIKLEKGWCSAFCVNISLNFYYSYGYMNCNTATIECVKIVDAHSISEVIGKMNYFKNLTTNYVRNRKNTKKYMLKEQAKDMKRYY